MPFSISGTSSGTTGSSGAERTVTAQMQALGKDDFLRLLTVQLKYQDPINPIRDQDFIAQLAQFTSLEQMHNLSERISQYLGVQLMASLTSQAVSLLGKTVTLETGQGSETGVVESIRFQDGEPRLVIDGRTYRVSDVVEVR